LEKQLQSIEANRILGVTSFDLFVPGMNFVFGEARCPGNVAVISTARLKPKAGNSRLFKERVVKEATHEVGHMLGLRHCDDVLCVMHFSERIEDTDEKKWAFCESCLTSLERGKVEQEIQS
jgi:archaemetzincin